MDIKRTDLLGVNLNLLLAFEALLQTRSVTRAAEKLRIGQPAASHALRRLRELLDDPLLVRTPGGMVPTARALDLEAPVRAILASIETTLFGRASFEPAEEARTFRVGATDYAQLTVLMPLMSELLRGAPSCRWIVSSTHCDTVARELEHGEIDLAVGVFPETTSARHQEVLFQETYACVFDPVACELEPPLGLDDWLALPQLMMSTRADVAGPVDEALAKLGERRFVAMSTPNFLAIPFMLMKARATAALPSRLASQCGRLAGLAVGPLPIETPGFDVAMLWHERSDRDPGAAWLREKIRSRVKV